MKSQVLSSFWEGYQDLNKTTRNQAKKAYSLWLDNPFYPSLHFKCVNRKENVWSIRITKNYRALRIFDNDTVT